MYMLCKFIITDHTIYKYRNIHTVFTVFIFPKPDPSMISQKFYPIFSLALTTSCLSQASDPRCPQARFPSALQEEHLGAERAGSLVCTDKILNIYTITSNKRTKHKTSTSTSPLILFLYPNF